MTVGPSVSDDNLMRSIFALAMTGERSTFLLQTLREKREQFLRKKNKPHEKRHNGGLRDFVFTFEVPSSSFSEVSLLLPTSARLTAPSRRPNRARERARWVRLYAARMSQLRKSSRTVMRSQLRLSSS